MNRKNLIPIIQNYIGMTPKDKGCTHWSEMQNKMADEIMALDALDAPHRDIDDWIFKAHQMKNRYILIISNVPKGIPSLTQFPVYCVDANELHTNYHAYHEQGDTVVHQIIEVYNDGTAEENIEIHNLL